MPTYEYECPRCGWCFDDLQPMPGQPRKRCLRCGTRARKVVSAVAFHLLPGGVGWAKDGYSKKPSKEHT